MYVQQNACPPNMDVPQDPRCASSLESALHQTGATLASIEALLKAATARLTGPVPVAMEKDNEPIGGIVALAERNAGHTQRLYELVERLTNLI